MTHWRTHSAGHTLTDTQRWWHADGHTALVKCWRTHSAGDMLTDIQRWWHADEHSAGNMLTDTQRWWNADGHTALVTCWRTYSAGDMLTDTQRLQHGTCQPHVHSETTFYIASRFYLETSTHNLIFHKVVRENKVVKAHLERVDCEPPRRSASNISLLGTNT